MSSRSISLSFTFLSQVQQYHQPLLQTNSTSSLPSPFSPLVNTKGLFFPSLILLFDSTAYRLALEVVFMDWSSSKGPPPSWDWPEPELQQQQQSLPPNNTDGFSVDLKLGSVIQSQTQQLGSCINSPLVLSLPSKRARAASNSTAPLPPQQTAYCLVDDCRSDLSNCREYHRRHKVCEVHSKTPEVTIQGRKQRFCQQCSRFHALDEFDEGKRSCRKRLDGHNRRRRKPQPETHLQQGNYMTNFPVAGAGNGMLSFGVPPPHTHELTSVISPHSWSGSVNEIKDPNDMQPHLNFLDKQTPFTGYSSRHREAKQLTFLRGENQKNHHAPSDQKVYYDGLTTQAPDSDCALSLLSRPMLPVHTTTEINFRNSIPMQPPQAGSSSGQRSSHFSTLQPIVTVSDVNFNNMFQTGTNEPNGHMEEPQTLPFYWD